MSNPSRLLATALASAALAFSTGAVQAAGPVSDPLNDFLPSFTGVHNADLDVVSAYATYDPGSNTFVFTGTMDGAIGTTASSLYVWGVDRGQGTARFGALASGVLFDSVISLKADGTGAVSLLPGATTSLAAGSVLISGNTITATVSGDLLPSDGLPLTAYTWNLWPRDTTQAGTAAISDFAPDNSNVAVAVVRSRRRWR